MTAMPRRKHSAVMREALPLRGARTADVGCGDGALVRFMTREGARVIGVEPSEVQLSRARAADAAGGERYVRGLAERLPLSDAAFDAVVFFNALHHVPVEAQAAALGEAARVVRPGGLVYVMEPIAAGPYFEMMRPVEDETFVRAKAYEALKQALRGPVFEETDEICYEAPFRYRSFDGFRESFLAIDGRRKERVAAMETELRPAFDSAGEHRDDGIWFYQPSRLNLLRRSA